jgi:hypothetical protein
VRWALLCANTAENQNCLTIFSASFSYKILKNSANGLNTSIRSQPDRKMPPHKALSVPCKESLKKNKSLNIPLSACFTLHTNLNH